MFIDYNNNAGINIFLISTVTIFTKNYIQVCLNSVKKIIKDDQFMSNGRS